MQARLDKLASSGVITGWGPDLSPEALGFPVTAFLTLEIRQGLGGGHDAVGAHLAAIPEVLEAHTITGAGDLWARVVARSNADLQRVIDQVLGDPGIDRSTTVIALATQIPHRVLPLRRAQPLRHGRRSCDDLRRHLGLVDGVGEGDDADARAQPLHSPHRRGQSVRAGLQLAARHGVRRLLRVHQPDRLACRPLRQGVTRPDPVGDVEVGPGRLDHRQGERLVAVGHRQVGRRPDRLGQRAQHRHRQVAQQGLHRAGEVEHAEPDEEPAARVTTDQSVLLERADQAVDDRAVDLEPTGELRDGQPFR